MPEPSTPQETARACDRCGREARLVFLPEYAAHFCEQCAANPRANEAEKIAAALNADREGVPLSREEAYWIIGALQGDTTEVGNSVRAKMLAYLTGGR